MELLKVLDKVIAGYPGGWKKYARGLHGDEPPPFQLPADPTDRRSLIPPLGLQEYWYPALPAKDVSWRKPVGLRMCGIDLVFFRDKNGQVQALWDYCPHRGAYLSWGDCFWKGHLSCPYHGATFNGDGECVEFITEGPDSKMPGRLKAKKYPTVTLKGVVFVWMGEGEPVHPEEDIPWEFFDKSALVHTAWDYWQLNWIVALENTFDAHNCFWVHRNAIRVLMSRLGGRPRTPIGYRVKIVDDKCVKALFGTEKYYSEKYGGKIPHQMYYPRAQAIWPLHRWRLLWTWFTDPQGRTIASRTRRQRPPNPEEWGGEGFGQRLPSMRRSAIGSVLGTRWCVPVQDSLTRLFYVKATWPQSSFALVLHRLRWPFENWLSNFNFQNQDRDVAATVRYQYPEFLSSTDSYVISFRKLITDHGRGMRRAEELPEEVGAERLVYESDRAFGLNPLPEVVSSREARS